MLKHQEFVIEIDGRIVESVRTKRSLDDLGPRKVLKMMKQRLENGMICT